MKLLLIPNEKEIFENLCEEEYNEGTRKKLNQMRHSLSEWDRVKAELEEEERRRELREMIEQAEQIRREEECYD